MQPAPEAETDEQAREREQQHEQERQEYAAEQERGTEAFKQQREREEQEYEAEQARGEEQRKTRAATFERILENAPESFTATQLRVLLRAIVNLDPYTFADGLAEDIAADNENEQRSAEEVLLSTIDATADDKLTRFTLRLALAGHVGIPREGECDFLTEAEAVFAPPQPKKKAATKKAISQHQSSPLREAQPRAQLKRQLPARRRLQPSQRREPVSGSRFISQTGKGHGRHPFGFSRALIPLHWTRSYVDSPIDCPGRSGMG